MQASKPMSPGIADERRYDVRSARADERECLAQLWFHAWRDGHADVVPRALVHARTLSNFRERLRTIAPSVRVIASKDAVKGFYFIKQDQLEQLFVSAEARGTGVATSLITAAENDLAACGVRTAWLACAIGNDRAARFYKKHGWRCSGVATSRLDLGDREFILDVWRFEKRLVALE